MSNDRATEKQEPNKTLLAIAIFKWVKGSLLIFVALGLFRLLHRDIAETLEHFANALRVDPDNHYLATLLARVQLIDDRKIKVISGLTLAYSALFFTEGTGLFFEKKWAEYLTLIATASFMPLEIYELVRHATLLKSVTLALNTAILVALIVILRRKRRESA